MSISLRVSTARLVGVGAAALALSAAAASPAAACAHGRGPGGDGWDGGGRPPGYHNGGPKGGQNHETTCEFSLDGEKWAGSVQVDDVSLKPGTDGKVHIKVRPAGEGTCTVSLASYLTHGPTWETSGKQAFVDFDSVTVGGRFETDTLNVVIPDAGCFAQVDLYKGDTQFDGQVGHKHGPLPEGPDHAVIKDALISSWNGGTKDCTANQSPSPTPSETASGSPSPTPTDSVPATGSPSPSDSAPATGSPSPSDSAPATGSPSASASASASSSEAAPVPSGSSSSAAASTGGALASTGSSGTGMLAGVAGALAVLGGAVLFFVRRGRTARH